MLNENGWQVFQGDALLRLRELKGAGTDGPCGGADVADPGAAERHEKNA